MIQKLNNMQTGLGWIMFNFQQYITVTLLLIHLKMKTEGTTLSLVLQPRPFFLNEHRRHTKKGTGELLLPFSFKCPQILGTGLVD